MTAVTGAALQAVLSTAAPGDTVQLLPGVHTMTASVIVPTGVTVAGAGDGSTILSWPSGPAGTDVVGFSVAGSATVTLRDLTLQGPTIPRAGGKYTYAILVSGTPANTTGELTCERVRITKPAGAGTGWYRGVQVQAGSITDTGGFDLHLNDCDITTDNGGLNVYCPSNGTAKTVWAVDTHIHDLDGSHCAYIHPGVAFEFLRCRFGTTPSYALQHYSGGADGIARFARFVDCDFDASATLGVLTSNSAGASTTFKNCRFARITPSTAAITSRSSLVVESCKFDLAADCNGVQGTDAGTMRIVGCEFRNTGGTSGNGASISATGGTTRVESCTFDLRSTGTGAPKAIRAHSATANPTVTVEHCHIHASQNTGTTGGEAPYAVYVGDRASATLIGCRLTGYYIPVYGAISLLGTGTLTVDNTEFAIASNSRVAWQTSGTPAGALMYSDTNQRLSGLPLLLR